MKDVRPEHNRLLNDIYRKPVKLSKPAMFHNYVRMISQSRICVSFKKIRVVCGELNVFFQPEMSNWLRLKWLKIINLKKILLGKRHTLQHTMINGYTGALTPRWAKKQTKEKKKKELHLNWDKVFWTFSSLCLSPAFCDDCDQNQMRFKSTIQTTTQTDTQGHISIHKTTNRTAAAVSVLCAKQALLTQSRTINLEIKRKEQPYLRINMSHLC